MEIDPLEEEGNKLKIRILDEGHTFSNALRKKLHQDDSVETAAYNIDHPLVGDPIMHVKTSGDISPKEALIKAATQLGEDYKEARQKFEDALEE